MKGTTSIFLFGGFQVFELQNLEGAATGTVWNFIGSGRTVRAKMIATMKLVNT